MPNSAFKRFGGSVAGAGAVEERNDVRGAFFEAPAKPSGLDQRGRNAAGEAADHSLHRRLALGLIGFSVGCDDTLLDAPMI